MKELESDSISKYGRSEVSDIEYQEIIDTPTDHLGIKSDRYNELFTSVDPEHVSEIKKTEISSDTFSGFENSPNISYEISLDPYDSLRLRFGDRLEEMTEQIKAIPFNGETALAESLKEIGDNFGDIIQSPGGVEYMTRFITAEFGEGALFALIPSFGGLSLAVSWVLKQLGKNIIPTEAAFEKLADMGEPTKIISKTVDGKLIGEFPDGKQVAIDEKMKAIIAENPNSITMYEAIPTDLIEEMNLALSDLKKELGFFGEGLEEYGGMVGAGTYLGLLEVFKDKPDLSKKIKYMGAGLGVLDSFVGFGGVGFDMSPLLGVVAFKTVSEYLGKSKMFNKLGPKTQYLQKMTPVLNVGFKVVETGLIMTFIADTLGFLEDNEWLGDGLDILDGVSSIGAGMLAKKGVQFIGKQLTKGDQGKIETLIGGVEMDYRIYHDLLSPKLPPPLLSNLYQLSKEK